jgi:hypothetical protein
MEKMPTWGGGATGAKKIGGPMIRKTPPIYNNPQQAKKMTNLRQKMISGNRLKAAASKRIALGGLRKKMAASGKVSDWGGGSKGLKRTLPSIKQKADWAKAVRDNPKGINFAALRKNDKTWKGPK